MSELSEEDKKAINYCKYTIDLANRLDEVIINLRKEPVNKVLNLIENQQAELEKKDKMIDEMAEMITEAKFCYFKKKVGGELLGKYRCYNQKEWKEYFEKKVEGK